MGLMHKLPPIVDPLPGGKTMIDAVSYIINWARSNSIWPLTYGTSCCAIEMMAAAAPRYDISRFGSEVFRASPRQCDLIILAGTITEKMAGPLKTLYDQMSGPKYVIAMGACTISGGPFYYDNYSVVKGADRILPVDVYIPGCPPRPEALFNGLLMLQEKIRKTESLRNTWHEHEIYTKPATNTWSDAAKAWDALEKIKDQEQAEARAKFKEENPDYQAFKAVRVVAPAFPEVPRKPDRPRGKSNLELWKLIQAKFPGLKLYKKELGDHEVSDTAAVEALGTDYTLDFEVPVDQYVALATFLKQTPDLSLEMLLDLTAVDFTDHFDVVVQLLSVTQGQKVFFRVSLPKKEVSPEEAPTAILASVPTLSGLWPAANWKEREVYDMFGIDFTGHPDMRRLFMEDDFVGYPLRKDFVNPNIIKRPY